MHVSLSYQLVLERLNMKYVQPLAESPNLRYVPSIYAYAANSTEPPALDLQDAFPTIDFSLLTSTDPDLRSKMIQELDMACKDWGFFWVVTHGVPESLMNMVLEKSKEFFDLTEEEKKEFEEKGVLDPIRYGTSLNSKKDEIFYWRDFIKVIVHPEFNCPSKPIRS
ncbi:putative flavanone 3-dioxygenase [Helianthus annuus]|nr:putative flavanone 3-dioxygenase [Helianthus annuus]